MNIHDANRISIPEILAKLNLEPKKSQNTKSWYLSPFRNEKTASFQVDLKTNRWYDFGEGFGGDVVDFVCNYLKYHKEAHSKSDALRWIKNMSDDSVDFLKNAPIPNDSDKDAPALIFKKSGEINHLGLVNYLAKRGIPLLIAKKHLKEVQVLNKVTNRKIIALGLSNEEGGFELRNPIFKGCIAPKAISFIRGEIPKPHSISIFEGFMDYLSIVTQMNGRPLKGDAIILNSLSCLSQINAYIRGYGYTHVYTWMDNDEAGKKATIMLDNFLKSQEGIIHKPMNTVYASYKDVNEWHISKQF